MSPAWEWIGSTGSFPTMLLLLPLPRELKEISVTCSVLLLRYQIVTSERIGYSLLTRKIEAVGYEECHTRLRAKTNSWAICCCKGNCQQVYMTGYSNAKSNSEDCERCRITWEKQKRRYKMGLWWELNTKSWVQSSCADEEYGDRCITSFPWARFIARWLLGEDMAVLCQPCECEFPDEDIRSRVPPRSARQWHA